MNIATGNIVTKQGLGQEGHEILEVQFSFTFDSFVYTFQDLSGRMAGMNLLSNMCENGPCPVKHSTDDLCAIV